MSSGNIIVTGFGPFQNHPINASWESVKLLPDEINGYKIIKKQIPVSYCSVDEMVPEFWKEYIPELVIHVGVSSLASKITLESCAYSEGYNRKDISNNCPLNGTTCSTNSSSNCIQVALDVHDICDHINATKSLEACVSVDAGRYLCEYTLYTSLSVDKNKVMFIHVPPLGQPFSEQQLAEGLVEIIQCALKQLKMHNSNKQCVS